MVPLRLASLLLCGAVLAPGLHAAVLIHEYALRGSLEDNRGGEPLSAIGGQITALGYVFAANQGLQFSSRDFTPADYSVEFSFKLNDVSGPTKLVDFHNLTKDVGLYQINGALQFNPTPSSTVIDFTPGGNVHVVLTRNGVTNIVTAYVNGQERFSFLDDLGLAATPGFSNKLTFFAEADSSSGGTMNYLRVFNGTLSASEVSILYAAGPPSAIPEPSIVGLLALGAAAAWFHRRRWG